MKIFHVITGLKTGGAEILLARLAECLKQRGHEQHVVSLGPPGEVAERIRAFGVPVTELGARGIRDLPGAFLRLVRILRQESPCVVQTWMYHADLLGGLAARLFSKAVVVWGIHHTTMDVKEDKRSTRMLVKLCVPLSRRIPHAIICCARSSAQVHASFGYDASRLKVVANGTDVTAFTRDSAAAARFGEAYGIEPKKLLVGWAGRNHPQKDPENFVRAAAIVATKVPDALFIMAGSGIDSNNVDLKAIAEEVGLGDRLRLIGRCSDMAGFYAALDVFVLSAVRGEAMPLVVGEAMAAETPCVVTNVGDAWELVGDTGRRVPASSRTALAKGICELLELPFEERRAEGRRSRERIHTEFSLDAMTDGYLEVWNNALTTSVNGKAG